MNDAERRAQQRRSTYEGAIVAAGTPKPRLREESFTIERLEQMWALCVAQWVASDRALPVFSRRDMPGEIFRIDR